MWGNANGGGVNSKMKSTHIALIGRLTWYSCGCLSWALGECPLSPVVDGGVDDDAAPSADGTR